MHISWEVRQAASGVEAGVEEGPDTLAERDRRGATEGIGAEQRLTACLEERFVGDLVGMPSPLRHDREAVQEAFGQRLLIDGIQSIRTQDGLDGGIEVEDDVLEVRVGGGHVPEYWDTRQQRNPLA